MSFEPISVKYALTGSTIIGVLNSIPTFIAALLVNIALIPEVFKMSLGGLILDALLVGVIGTCLTTLANRPEQVRQQKTSPHGPWVIASELAGMTLMGGVFTPLVAESASVIPHGILIGFIGCLPSFIVMSPWRESESEDKFSERNKQFGDKTREMLEEHKEEIAEREQGKINSKNGNPWSNKNNQNWWKSNS